MPGRRDEVDQRLAARLAWSTEVPDDETLAHAPPTIDSPETFETFWEAFQAAIQRTLVSPADVQSAAYVELMRALAAVFPQIGALPADPLTTRLARLHLRLREAFPRDLPYSWVDVAARLPVEPNSPESLEFLLEAVHCRDALVVDAIDAHLSSTSWSEAFPGLAAKLLPVLPTLGPHARRHALSMLARGRWPEARPLLREVLRGRSLHERTLVLHQHTRHQLVTPELAARLVLDLAEHPRPPETRWEYLANLVHTNALRNAVAPHDSPELRAAAHRLVRGHRDPLDTDVADFGTTFGLTLLAPLEPDFVLGHLRSLATSLREERRWNAVAIAPFVPAPHGPLWLAELARDPSLEVASAARDAAAETLPDLELVPRRLDLFVGLVPPDDVERADEELARVEAAGAEAGPLLELHLRRAAQPVSLAVLLRWMSVRRPSDALPGAASAEEKRATVGSLVPRLAVVAPARRLGHGLATLALHDPWLGASVLDALPPDVARAAYTTARRWIGHADLRRAAAGIAALERGEPTAEEKAAVLHDLLTAGHDRLDALFLHRVSQGALRRVWEAAADQLRQRAFAENPPDFALLRHVSTRDPPFESEEQSERRRESVMTRLEPLFRDPNSRFEDVAPLLTALRPLRASLRVALRLRLFVAAPTMALAQAVYDLADDADHDLGTELLAAEAQDWLAGLPSRVRTVSDARLLLRYLDFGASQNPGARRALDAFASKPPLFESAELDLLRLCHLFHVGQPDPEVTLGAAPDPEHVRAALEAVVRRADISACEEWGQVTAAVGDPDQKPFADAVLARLDDFVDERARADLTVSARRRFRSPFWIDDPAPEVLEDPDASARG